MTITGAVAAPGVYELAFGTPMSDLLAAAGGSTEPLQALLVGGYFGTWVDASRRDRLRLAREDLRSVGCSLGSGVLIALGESACGLHETARVIAYLADAVGRAVRAVRVRAARDRRRVRRARRRGRRTPVSATACCAGRRGRGRGACHHPDGAARFVESALRVFGGGCRVAPARVAAGRAAGRPAAGRIARWPPPGAVRAGARRRVPEARAA